MDDRQQQAAAPKPDNRDPQRSSTMERHQREQSQFRTRPGGAPSAQYRAEGFDFVRDAIHRTYK